MGAAIAPGSQKWVGTSADLLVAPTRISAIAVRRYGPALCHIGSITISESRNEPADAATISSPTSIARPPAVVEIRAFSAARREA